MVRWQGVCVGLLGLLCGAWMQGQAKTDAAQASDAVLPLSVELLAPLSAKSTHAGAPVLGKVTQGWVGPGCTLARGGTVGGHVVDVHLEPQARVTRLALIFDRADCGGKAPPTIPIQAVCRDRPAGAALPAQSVRERWPIQRRRPRGGICGTREAHGDCVRDYE